MNFTSKNQKWCLIRVVSNVWHVSSTTSSPSSLKEEKVSFQKVRRHFLSNDPMMEETSKMTGMRRSLKTSLEQLHRWINLAENMAKNVVFLKTSFFLDIYLKSWICLANDLRLLAYKTFLNTFTKMFIS